MRLTAAFLGRHFDRFFQQRIESPRSCQNCFWRNLDARGEKLHVLSAHDIPARFFCQAWTEHCEISQRSTSTVQPTYEFTRIAVSLIYNINEQCVLKRAEVYFLRGNMNRFSNFFLQLRIQNFNFYTQRKFLSRTDSRRKISDLSKCDAWLACFLSRKVLHLSPLRRYKNFDRRSMERFASRKNLRASHLFRS